MQATIGGLTPGTTYFYKLLAKNTDNGQENLGEGEAVQSFRTLGPDFGAVSVSGVSSSSATFDAPVNPDGAPTSVYFEYGPCASLATCASSPFGSKSSPEAIGSGEIAGTCRPARPGSAPGTSYHYRVAAQSELTAGDPDWIGGWRRVVHHAVCGYLFADRWSCL